MPKQGKLSRRFIDDIIRGFCGKPPQFHCLIMAGKKIHVSLFADWRGVSEKHDLIVSVSALCLRRYKLTMIPGFHRAVVGELLN